MLSFLCFRSFFWQRAETENALDECVQRCRISEYAIFDECRECGESCFGCVGNPFHCTLCQDGFYLHQNHCHPKCPAGYISFFTIVI